MEIAYVLFTDIVGYSKLPLDEQVVVVEQLKGLISETSQFRDARDKKSVLTMHTGDGMALAFFSGPEAPALCAMELAASLKDRPHLKLRMGIHTGPVYRVADIQGGENAAGGGINIAQRVMDCGDAGHILLSDTVADMLAQHSKWAKHVHELGVAEVKHGVKVHLFSLHDGKVGNADLPSKLKMSSATAETVRQAALPAELQSRYNVLRPVGRGGMGTVYEAIDRETGAKVALKVLNPEIAQDAAVAERFKAELLLTRKITHRNVCRVHDLYRFDGTAFISMEYVDGESLRERLNRTGQMPLNDALSIAGQIMDGLEEAHRQNITHRDLKPENIMITTEGTVKIMDFGLAKAGGTDLTTSNAISGTPAYMSPEQALGQMADHRSDIYSFGLVLYEMLCGKRAFSGDSAVAIAMKQVNENPIAPRQLAPDLSMAHEALVLRCLEKDPARRFASIAELREALRAASQTPAPGNSTRTIAVIAIIAIVVVAFAAWFKFSSNEPQQQAASVPAQPRPAGPAPEVKPAAVTPPQTSGPSIAVLDFANLQNDAQYASLEVGIAEAFTSSFVGSKRFRVVERNQLEKIRSELNLNRSELVDPATAQKIGRLIGAQYLMLGSFQVLGGQIRINARLLRVETGEILQTDAVTGAASSALSLPDTLAAKFLANVK